MRVRAPSVPHAQTGLLRPSQQWFTADAVLASPQQPWLVEGHIPVAANACLFGPSGAGKSFLALDMALSVAAGVPFLTHFGVRRGGVLYVYSEGAAGLRSRLRAWLAARRIESTDIRFSFQNYGLTETHNAERLVESGYYALGRRHPALIVVDTLTRNFGGHDTDSNRDMALYAAGVDYVRKYTGAAVLTVHHTGWGDSTRERGGAAFRDCLDTSVRVKPCPGGTIEVSCSKQRDAGGTGAYSVRKEAVRLDDGGESVALSFVGAAPEGRRDKGRRAAGGRETDEAVLLRHIPEVAPDRIATDAVRVEALCAGTGWKPWKVYGVLRRLGPETVFKERVGKTVTAPLLYYRPVPAPTTSLATVPRPPR